MGQISGMLVSATAVQRVEFLVALAVGRAGCVCCAEQGWVLGRISDDALAVTGVTQWYFTCRCLFCQQLTPLLRLLSLICRPALDEHATLQGAGR